MLASPKISWQKCFFLLQNPLQKGFTAFIKGNGIFVCGEPGCSHLTQRKGYEAWYAYSVADEFNGIAPTIEEAKHEAIQAAIELGRGGSKEKIRDRDQWFAEAVRLI